MQPDGQIIFLKLQNLKHWPFHLQGLAGQVEVRSPDQTQEGTSSHCDAFMTSPHVVSWLWRLSSKRLLKVPHEIGAFWQHKHREQEGRSGSSSLLPAHYPSMPWESPEEHVDPALPNCTVTLGNLFFFVFPIAWNRWENLEMLFSKHVLSLKGFPYLSSQEKQLTWWGMPTQKLG